MRTVVISNFKGGVGKTTTAVNLAYNLAALHRKRVLIVDADPQGNTTYFYSKYADASYTTADVIRGTQRASRVIRRTRYKGLDVMPGGMELDYLKEESLCGLEEGLKTVADRYDYCVVDCQPSQNINTLSAWTAADDILIPVKPDVYAVNGMEIMLDAIKEVSGFRQRLDIVVAVVTMYRPSRSIFRAIEDMGTRYNILMMDSVIRMGEAANSSSMAKRPLTLHRSGAGVTQDYQDLTAEYLERVGDLR